MEKGQILILFLVASILVAVAEACDGDACRQSCIASGHETGKCEKRWYRWKYSKRCKCNPCEGKLVLGACITSIGGGVKCDGNGENCSPTGSIG